jgi:hypothetical protein
MMVQSGLLLFYAMCNGAFLAPVSLRGVCFQLLHHYTALLVTTIFHVFRPAAAPIIFILYGPWHFLLS